MAATRQTRGRLSPTAAARIYRPQAWLSPVLLVDGRMEGVWSNEARGRRLSVVVEPFRRQPRAVRQAAEAEATRLAAFLDRSLELGWLKA